MTTPKLELVGKRRLAAEAESVVLSARQPIVDIMKRLDGPLPRNGNAVSQVLARRFSPSDVTAALDQMLAEGILTAVWIGKAEHVLAVAADTEAQSDPSDSYDASGPQAEKQDVGIDEAEFSVQVATDVERERVLLYRFLAVLLVIVATVLTRQAVLLYISR